MDRIINYFVAAGYDYDVAVVLAECYEHDHPAARIREEHSEQGEE